jgi:hypothetical protein
VSLVITRYTATSCLILPRLGFKGPGFYSWQEQQDISSLKYPDRLWGPPRHLFSKKRLHFPGGGGGVRRAECEPDHPRRTVPRLRMSGAIGPPLLRLNELMSCRGTGLPFTDSQQSDLKTGVNITSETSCMSSTPVQNNVGIIN